MAVSGGGQVVSRSQIKALKQRMAEEQQQGNISVANSLSNKIQEMEIALAAGRDQATDNIGSTGVLDNSHTNVKGDSSVDLARGVGKNPSAKDKEWVFGQIEDFYNYWNNDDSEDKKGKGANADQKKDLMGGTSTQTGT